MVPERVHAAAEQSKYDELDRYIESAIKKYKIPGAALGVVQKDSPLYIKGYGTADSKNTRITPQMPFILGSTSKSFTALAVMQLVSAESTALMHGEQGAPVEENGIYGMVLMKKGTAITHEGAVENFQSNLLIDGDTGIVLLLNSNNFFVPANTLLTDGVRDILKGIRHLMRKLPT
jgi:hypothetical protein